MQIINAGGDSCVNVFAGAKDGIAVLRRDHNHSPPRQRCRGVAMIRQSPAVAVRQQNNRKLPLRRPSVPSPSRTKRPKFARCFRVNARIPNRKRRGLSLRQCKARVMRVLRPSPRRQRQARQQNNPAPQKFSRQFFFSRKKISHCILGRLIFVGGRFRFLRLQAAVFLH